MPNLNNLDKPNNNLDKFNPLKWPRYITSIILSFIIAGSTVTAAVQNAFGAGSKSLGEKIEMTSIDRTKGIQAAVAINENQLPTNKAEAKKAFTAWFEANNPTENGATRSELSTQIHDEMLSKFEARVDKVIAEGNDVGVFTAGFFNEYAKGLDEGKVSPEALVQAEAFFNKVIGDQVARPAPAIGKEAKLTDSKTSVFNKTPFTNKAQNPTVPPSPSPSPTATPNSAPKTQTEKKATNEDTNSSEFDKQVDTSVEDVLKNSDGVGEPHSSLGNHQLRLDSIFVPESLADSGVQMQSKYVNQLAKQLNVELRENKGIIVIDRYDFDSSVTQYLDGSFAAQDSSQKKYTESPTSINKKKLLVESTKLQYTLDLLKTVKDKESGEAIWLALKALLGIYVAKQLLSAIARNKYVRSKATAVRDYSVDFIESISGKNLKSSVATKNQSPVETQQPTQTVLPNDSQKSNLFNLDINFTNDPRHNSILTNTINGGKKILESMRRERKESTAEDVVGKLRTRLEAGISEISLEDLLNLIKESTGKSLGNKKTKITLNEIIRSLGNTDGGKSGLELIYHSTSDHRRLTSISKYSDKGISLNTIGSQPEDITFDKVDTLDSIQFTLRKTEDNEVVDMSVPANKTTLLENTSTHIEDLGIDELKSNLLESPELKGFVGGLLQNKMSQPITFRYIIDELMKVSEFNDLKTGDFLEIVLTLIQTNPSVKVGIVTDSHKNNWSEFTSVSLMDRNTLKVNFLNSNAQPAFLNIDFANSPNDSFAIFPVQTTLTQSVTATPIQTAPAPTQNASPNHNRSMPIPPPATRFSTLSTPDSTPEATPQNELAEFDNVEFGGQVVSFASATDIINSIPKEFTNGVESLAENITNEDVAKQLPQILLYCWYQMMNTCKLVAEGKKHKFQMKYYFDQGKLKQLNVVSNLAMYSDLVEKYIKLSLKMRDLHTANKIITDAK